jgi:chemotaxis response regulator CheB
MEVDWMEKRRVAIIYDQHLLGESLSCILNGLQDLEIYLFWMLDPEAIPILERYPPDVLLIAEENSQVEISALIMGKIFDKYPTLPVIHIKLAQDVLQVLTSQSFPARSADLVEAVQRLSGPYREDLTS